MELKEVEETVLKREEKVLQERMQKKKVAFGAEVKVKVDETFKKKKSCLKTGRFTQQDLKGEEKESSKGKIKKRGELHVVQSKWDCMHCNQANEMEMKACARCKTPKGERNFHKDLMDQKELYKMYLKVKAKNKQ